FPWPSVYQSSQTLGRWRARASNFTHRFGIPSPWELEYFTQKCMNQNVRLIHAHFGTDGRYVLPVARRAGLPLIASFYGYDSSSFLLKFGGMGTRYLRQLFRLAAAFLVLSRAMLDDLV